MTVKQDRLANLYVFKVCDFPSEKYQIIYIYVSNIRLMGKIIVPNNCFF